MTKIGDVKHFLHLEVKIIINFRIMLLNDTLLRKGSNNKTKFSNIICAKYFNNVIFDSWCNETII